MIQIIAILVSVALFSDATTPTLWGSRVVGKLSGSSDPMYYYTNSSFKAFITHNSSELSDLTIGNGSCKVDGKAWGEPCSEGDGNATITIADVKAQEVLELAANYTLNGLSSTTFFVPGCHFPKPAPDEVDLETSFPLSRFVKGSASFNVSFAVQGANSNSWVVFRTTGGLKCNWFGTALNQSYGNLCTPLVKDEEKDLRVFHGSFPTKTNLSREIFEFIGNRTSVIVSIDYTQNGTSPEVAECNSFPSTAPATSSTTTTASAKTTSSATTTASAKTTSSGPAVMHAIEALMASLLMQALLC